MNAMGLLFALVWLGFVLYMLSLATRLVSAVEEIARQMGTRHMGAARQGPFDD